MKQGMRTAGERFIHLPTRIPTMKRIESRNAGDVESLKALMSVDRVSGWYDSLEVQ